MRLSDANEFLMGGGVRSAKFDKPGATVKGTVAREPELQQQREFTADGSKGELKFWDDKTPMQQIKVVLNTDEREDEDDNGERAIYLKANLLKAVQAAVKEAKAKGIAVGGKLAVKYTKNGESKGKGFPPKLYAAKYEAPDPLALAAEPEPVAAGVAAEDDNADLDF